MCRSAIKKKNHRFFFLLEIRLSQSVFTWHHRFGIDGNNRHSQFVFWFRQQWLFFSDAKRVITRYMNYHGDHVSIQSFEQSHGRI